MQKKTVAALALSVATLSSCSPFSKNENETPSPVLPPIVDPLEPSGPQNPEIPSPEPIKPAWKNPNPEDSEEAKIPRPGTTPSGTSGNEPSNSGAVATGTVDDSEVEAAISEIDRLLNGIAGE